MRRREPCQVSIGPEIYHQEMRSDADFGMVTRNSSDFEALKGIIRVVLI